MNTLVINQAPEVALYKEGYAHFVETVESQYSLCGLDVTEADWSDGNDPDCPECELRHQSCPCDKCKEARNV